MKVKASVSTFRFFYVPDLYSNIVSVQCTAKPLTVKQAEKCYGTAVIPERDCFQWAIAVEGNTRCLGFYIAGDSQYFFIAVPTSMAKPRNPLDVTYHNGTPVIKHIYRYTNARIIFQPTNYTPYQWLQQQECLIESYLDFYNQTFGHINEIPGFWDHKCIVRLLHKPLDSASKTKLYWAGVRQLLSTHDIPAHTAFIKILTGGAYMDFILHIAILNSMGLYAEQIQALKDILPYLACGLYVPAEFLSKVRVDLPTAHETLHLYTQVEEAYLQGQALTQVSKDCQRTKREAREQVLQHLFAVIPQSNKAKMLLEQCEQYSQGCIEQESMERSIKNFTKRLVPPTMLQLSGSSRLTWEEVPIKPLFAWIMSWYASQKTLTLQRGF